MKLTHRVAATAAVGLAFSSIPALAADPIKIGLVLPFSAGPYVPIANEIADSLAMAIADNGGEVAGRKIEILREDTTHKPAVAQEKAKKLVFEDKADILVGPVGSGELAALFDFANQSKTPLIIQCRRQRGDGRPLQSLGAAHFLLKRPDRARHGAVDVQTRL